MHSRLKILLSTVIIVSVSGPALAAGSGTGIESGFTEVGTDLNTLLGGAGGFIIIVVSIMLGALMLAIGRGWTYAVTAFACAMFLGYGVTALQGIAGVTATADILLSGEGELLLSDADALPEVPVHGPV